MFDGKTLDWMEKREIIKNRNGFYFCGHCQNYNPSHYDQYTGYCTCDYIECPLVINYKDAAEFEARVAAKLSGAGPEPCEHGKVKHCPWPRSVIEGKRTCDFCRLKYARIAVEKEMENE